MGCTIEREPDIADPDGEDGGSFKSMGSHLEGDLTALEARLAALEQRTTQAERRLTATEQRLINAESLIRMNGKRLTRIEQAPGPARGTNYDATVEPAEE